MSALAEVTAIQNQPETPFQEFCQGRYEADLMRAVNSGIVQQDDLDRFLEESALNQYIEDRKEPLQGEFRALLAMDKIYEDEGLVANDDIVQAEYDQAMERASQLQEESAQESTEGIVRSAAACLCSCSWCAVSEDVAAAQRCGRADFTSGTACCTSMHDLHALHFGTGCCCCVPFTDMLAA